MSLDKSQPVAPLIFLPSLKKKRQTSRLAWLLILCLLSGVGYAVYRQVIIVPSQQARSRVLTHPVESQSLPIKVSANGTVKPERSINVSPKNSGVLKSLLVKEGDTYILEGRNLTTLDDDELAYIRNQRIGFVFQQFNLLPRATALENVMLPMVYANTSKHKRRQRAVQALTRVGLADRLFNRPSQLSGGQQQRVAIARALVNRPALVLADEPTGALDTKTSHELMDLLTELNEQGITVVIVTHEPEIAAQTKRIIRVQDGLIVS